MPSFHAHLKLTMVSCRADEPGAWYAMLPLEVVYAFDPVPPEPQHEEAPTPMSRSGDGDSDGSGMDVEANSNGMGDGGGVSHTPAYADWTLPAKDAHHIIGGQARSCPFAMVCLANFVCCSRHCLQKQRHVWPSGVCCLDFV